MQDKVECTCVSLERREFLPKHIGLRSNHCSTLVTPQSLQYCHSLIIHINSPFHRFRHIVDNVEHLTNPFAQPGVGHNIRSLRDILRSVFTNLSNKPIRSTPRLSVQRVNYIATLTKNQGKFLGQSVQLENIHLVVCLESLPKDVYHLGSRPRYRPSMAINLSHILQISRYKAHT